MFAIERQRLIKQLLLQNRHVTVSELSNYLNVSEVTIRKDLEKLENESYLTRTHGGAIIHDWVANDAPPDTFALPENSQEAYINSMSEIALKLIAQKKVIYLDGGNVSLAIAKRLDQAGEIVVLTCDLAVAMQAKGNPNVQVVLPGGSVSPRGKLQGTSTIASLKPMHVELALVEIHSFTTKGFYTSDFEASVIIQLLKSISDQMFFLCPANSFGQPSLFQIGALTMADGIISTAEIDGAFKKSCAEQQIKLYTAFDL